MKLSDKKKQNFYGRVAKLRETIETLLKTAKKVETLLQQTMTPSLEEQKKVYDEVYPLFQQLPKQEQQKYYADVMHLKSKLENGA